MGLDTSHGCWHGAYSTFMRWRSKLAEVADYPPLCLMDGFFHPDNWWLMTKRPDVENPKMYKFAALVTQEHSELSYEVSQAFTGLPIPWTHFESDPLTKLLNHSDCEGSIAAADCGPIADRLTELLPLLPDEEAAGHIGHWREKTQTFIDGLRKAAAAGEDVDFY